MRTAACPDPPPAEVVEPPVAPPLAEALGLGSSDGVSVILTAGHCAQATIGGSGRSTTTRRMTIRSVRVVPRTTRGGHLSRVRARRRRPSRGVPERRLVGLGQPRALDCGRCLRDAGVAAEQRDPQRVRLRYVGIGGRRRPPTSRNPVVLHPRHPDVWVGTVVPHRQRPRRAATTHVAVAIVEQREFRSTYLRRPRTRRCVVGAARQSPGSVD